MKRMLISWFHQYGFSMICVLDHEICRKGRLLVPQLRPFMKVTTSHHCGRGKPSKGGALGLAQKLTFLTPPRAEHAHWVLWGREGERRRNVVRNTQTAWTTSCTMLLLKGKENVFSRVEETKKWELHTSIWLHKKVGELAISLTLVTSTFEWGCDIWIGWDGVV